ncbi:MAG: hypothetical protein ACREEW_07480, partial [Caulobacteraceae bacterium]
MSALPSTHLARQLGAEAVWLGADDLEPKAVTLAVLAQLALRAGGGDRLRLVQAHLYGPDWALPCVAVRQVEHGDLVGYAFAGEGP